MCSSNLLLLTLLLALSSVFPQNELVPCVQDSDCQLLIDPTAKCIANTCAFNSSRMPSGPMQVVTALGRKCSMHDECNILRSICVTNECTCQDGTVASQDLKQCLFAAKSLGDMCSEDVQCASIEHTRCDALHCRCAMGYRKNATANGCDLINGIGGKCTTDDDCDVENSQCTPNATCACWTDYFAYEMECVEKSYTINSRCQSDDQCTRDLGRGSHCLDNLCQCMDGFKYVRESRQCMMELIPITDTGASPSMGSTLVSPFGMIAACCMLRMRM